MAAVALDPAVGAVEVNLEAALRGLTRAADAGARVLALPEMWPTSFAPAADPGLVRAGEEAVDTLAAAAVARGVIVVGSAYAASSDGGWPTNRAHVLGVPVASGSALGSRPTAEDTSRESPRGAHPGYDKVHLFSPTGEPAAFRAGTTPPPVIATDVVRIAPIVCYDLRFPDLVRVPVRAGAELLVVVAQWPDVRAEAWRALVAGRAAEGQCFVLAANRRGAEVAGSGRLVLEFSGHLVLAAPDGAVRVATSSASPGDLDAGRDLLLADIDLREVHQMRRAVPVLRDERRELYVRFAATQREFSP